MGTRSPNLAWFIGGSIISGLGDQFTLIALPWLVLRLTGDPFALGSTIALMGLPRTALMLFGGALADRYSPQRVLMLNKYANTALLGTLALLVWTGHATLPLVLALALAMGVAQAFGIPAGTSLLPHVVPPERLRAANGMLMGVRQATLLAGPLLAGLLFALAGNSGADRTAEMHALALAFGVDCASFAISAWTLAQARCRAVPKPAPEPVLRAVAAGIGYVARDPLLRSGFLYWGLCACVVGGTVQVALPLLAERLQHGASALGLMAAAHGTGALAGMVLGGASGRRRIANLGTLLLLFDAGVGLLLPLLGMVSETWQAMLVNLAIGALNGLANVAVFTWIQSRVAPAMLGRTMGLFMVVALGLAPLAAAATGWVAGRVTLQTLFGGAGAFLLAAAVLAWWLSPMREISDGPIPEADRVA